MERFHAIFNVNVAFGTAAGDLVAEKLNLGYLVSAIIFAALIAIVTVAHLCFKLNAILSFWAAYVLTRPLGASLGDYLSQPSNNNGLGLGPVLTSGIFLSVILMDVIYLTFKKKIEEKGVLLTDKNKMSDKDKHSFFIIFKTNGF